LLIKKRIDLWASVELSASYIARKNNYSYDMLFQRKFCFENLSNEGTYMAFSKNTNSSLLQKFKKALIKIKENGTYDAIMKKYL